MDKNNIITGIESGRDFSQLTEKNFLHFNLSADSHRILSGDQRVYSFIDQDLFSKFEKHIAPEDQEDFARYINIKYEGWFPLKLLTAGVPEQYWMQVRFMGNGSYLRCKLVQVRELLDKEEERSLLYSSVSTLLGFYNDLQFIYYCAEDLVYVYHGNGVYSFEEFSEKLKKAGPSETQQEEINGFLSSVKHGSLYYSCVVEGNLLDDDSSVTGTVLACRAVMQDDKVARVVGIIRPDRSGIKALTHRDRDFLTGALLKEDITAIATGRINDQHREGTALAIFDVDYFKSINDTYGHQRGDEVLKGVADILAESIGENALLGRIGGDEFLAVFDGIKHEDDLRVHFRAIKSSVKRAFPDLSPDGKSPLTISIGAACYPQDANSYDDVFMMADYCLYLAKSKGRNRYIIYTKEKHPSVDLILSGKMGVPHTISRENLHPADFILNNLFESQYGKLPSFSTLMSDFVLHFNIPCMLLYAGTPYRLMFEAGTVRLEDPSAAGRLGELLSREYDQELNRDFMVVNQNYTMPEALSEARDFLDSQDIRSFVEMRFKDAAGTPVVLLLLALKTKIQWNEGHFRYYRFFTKILEKYDFIDSYAPLPDWEKYV